MNKLRFIRPAVVVALVSASSFAAAELPAAAAAAFTTVETDAMSMVDSAWPVVISITVAFILIKLFKKAASKVA